MLITGISSKIHRPIPLTLTFVFVSFILTGCNEKVRENLRFLYPEYIKCDVIKVIDGQTFYCQIPRGREIEEVKLIGIEVPESIREKATEFSKSYLRRGVPVRLEQDSEGRDGHGRILAYVYIPGGEMLNTFRL